MSLQSLLHSGTLRILERHPDASNAVFVVDLQHEHSSCRAIYKPVAGEKPLWDFPNAALARREVAAYALSQSMGFSFVPETVWIDDGPAGPGSLQLWIDDASIEDIAVTTGPQDGWLHVLDAELSDGTPVQLQHRDDADLRAVAVFDAILNNGDRKGGHILRDPQGALFAVDHGVTFHSDPRLRTVLWGFAGQPITAEIIERTHGALLDLPEVQIALTESEVAALHARVRRLQEHPFYPYPSSDWPSIPWPVF